jgi:hypothetical protein
MLGGEHYAEEAAVLVWFHKPTKGLTDLIAPAN